MVGRPLRFGFRLAEPVVGRACGWQSLWLAEPVVGRPLRFGFRSTLVNAEPVVGRACGWLLTNFCRGSTLVNALQLVVNSRPNI